MEMQKRVDLLAASFGWADYLTFSAFLLVCCVMGFYFQFLKSKTSVQDFLLGGRTMSPIPVGVSMAVNFISGIVLLGIPSEVYTHGVHYFLCVCSFPVVGLMYQNTFLPIYMELKITSAYEYLERRYNRTVRYFGLFLFTISLVLYLPIVIYAAAMTFNQVTGVNIYVIVLTMNFVCILYTTTGGLKAIVWNDVIQTILMILSMLLVIIKGTLDVGGVRVVIERNINSTRLETPDFSIDPTIRQTFWSLLMGPSSVMFASNISSQTTIQKYLSLPNIRAAKKSMWVFIFGVFVINVLTAYLGLLLYAYFHHCDPFESQLIKGQDQLVPLFVILTLGKYPGLTGIFVGGIFSATLGTMACGLNSMSTVIFEDLYKKLFKCYDDTKSLVLIKCFVVTLGCLCGALVPVVQNLGLINQLNVTIASISNGTLIGFFLMGALFPWITVKGILTGGIFSASFMAWLCIESQSAVATGQINFVKKPVSVEDCNFNLQEPEKNISQNIGNEVFLLYRLSYLYYITFGAIICSVVAMVVSLCDSGDSKQVDSSLLVPFVRRFYRSSRDASLEYTSNYDRVKVKTHDSLIERICETKLSKEAESLNLLKVSN